MTSSSDSPELTCPICLEHFKRESYLDRCFHAFCYNCIVKWSKSILKLPNSNLPLQSIPCPLCKTENFSIVYDFSGKSFQRDYVNQLHDKSFLSNLHRFRLQCYNSELDLNFIDLQVQDYWKNCRYIRKRNIWINSWLKREIQSLLQEEDVDVIVHHIHGVIENFIRMQEKNGVGNSPERKREEFRRLVVDAAAPFVRERSERFVDELEMFLASELNIAAYDHIYMDRMGLSIESLE